GARTFAHTTRAPVPDRLQTGDVRIVDVDSTVDLALVGDTITTGLSQKTVARVRRETDTATVTGEGLGASIEKIVKSTVGSAIGTRVAFPVATVKDVRYEDGRLLFDWNGKPLRLFGTARVNGKPITWRPEDAQRFIDAVHARQAASGQR
ncbi:MAG: hypothetical protein JWN53_864, partial [Gemmatimonadetes bacterium]|nr:hypothetical protein [Gemmatimonadota bacterium]